MARHATRSRVRPVVALLAAVVAGGLGGCGDDAEDAGPDGSRDAERACAVADAGRVQIVADDLAWDVDCLEVPADEPVTIVVDNRDDGVAHNVHLTDAPGAPSTALETGPVVQELDVELPAGRYRYVCDIHPTMVGSLRAVGQSEP